MSYAYGKKSQAVLALLTEDPEITNKEIQLATGMKSVRYISDIRLEHGYLTKGIFACMDERNKAWVLSEAKRRGIGQGFVIDELVSKARKLARCDWGGEGCGEVVTNLDGDNLCKKHADAWVKGQRDG